MASITMRRKPMTKLTFVAAALVAAAAYTQASAARSNVASRHAQATRRPVPSSIVCGLRTLARSPQLLILHRLACRAQLTDGANGRVGGLLASPIIVACTDRGMTRDDRYATPSPTRAVTRPENRNLLV